MTPEEAFELMEGQILDCPRCKLHVICSDSFEEYTIEEVYESGFELYITIKKENNEDNQ